jgi:ADP-ribosyl-[dinitrogen reductase] hydrolase
MSEPRTSETHPLRVDFIGVPASGRLGMTFAPGKRQKDALTGRWARDLDLDLDRLSTIYGAELVVSVMEEKELRALCIPSLSSAVGFRGMGWLHVPVVDGGVPKDDLTWLHALRLVRARLLEGRTVIVHCMGGLGRTGTFVAAVLISFGDAPASAIEKVRTARPGAIETRAQEHFVMTFNERWREDVQGRIRGCLLFGAVGDALGAPVEFSSLSAIRAEHGPAGVRQMLPAYGRHGAITDDTQMTLFTVEGLLRAEGRWRGRGICSPSSVIRRAYYRWYCTQGEPVPKGLDNIATGWLFQQRGLHARRAPGNTCLSALRQSLDAQQAGRQPPVPLNDSKGCGGVMRVAPVGLLARDAWGLGAECAQLTHGHPAGSDTAACLAEMISKIMSGLPLAEAIREVWRTRRSACHEDTQRALDNAFDLLRSGAPPTSEAVESLGEGWVAEEALAISLYCALACRDPEAALSLAITHSGDSDSTGAITGNLLGAALGEKAIPIRWLETLELRDVIEQVADDVVALVLDGDVDEVRYPPD